MMISPLAKTTSWSVCARCASQRLQRRNYVATAGLKSAEDSRLPRVANPSFWSSLIPRPLRRASDPAEAAERAKRKQVGAGERRVGIIFMILGVLVGSNAIQLISIKRQTLNFSRKTDAKLSLLREVIQRVKKGEDVDVKTLLGTGDPDQEREWEEVIQELERPGMLDEGSRRREAQSTEGTADTKSNAVEPQPDASPEAQSKTSNDSRPKFLM